MTPSVAETLYAGAIDAIASIKLERSLTAPALSDESGLPSAAT
jgi:hypothetical protein